MIFWLYGDELELSIMFSLCMISLLKSEYETVSTGVQTILP